MFNRRKEEMEVMKQTLSCFETSQKNTELVLSSINALMKNEVESRQAIEQKKREEEEIDQKKAAYALNLCMVSVSQIIDYDDSNILAQEYETILNNLNLEHMPKDEALLSILKQLLDTITFFRIQDKEKEFIEKEYQQKMKNAIWSAVPNFGMIVGTGSPITMAISLATQVGIGYMNYRKTKAQNMSEREKQEWQLQRSAIEQLNGLRRELFDASWRMADKYNFPDKYRLTERQITQYNKILMDNDPWRKYERLNAIKEFFEAYPPFWYYFGNAANLIACQAKADNDMDVFDRYRSLAIEHFETYTAINEDAILREDHLASSCALEYLELLDLSLEENRAKGRQLLCTAVRSSGHACDVLQICALSYLRMGELEPAMKWLSYLVNEGYNTIVNAQLLSSLYACNSIGHHDGFLTEYKLLRRKVPERLLFPFPSEETSVDTLKTEFIDRQRETLLERYSYVLYEYCDKCSIEFNKCIPVPEEGRYYPDSFFSNNTRKKEERINQYTIVFANNQKAENFASRLVSSEFVLGYLRVLNEMMNSFESIIPEHGFRKEDILIDLSEAIKQRISSEASKMKDIQRSMQNGFRRDAAEALLRNDFSHFTEPFFRNLVCYYEEHVKKITSIDDFCAEETALHDFCRKHYIEDPDTQIWNFNRYQGDDEFQTEYFSSSLFGEEFVQQEKIAILTKNMARIALEYKEKVMSVNHAKIGLYVRHDDDTRNIFKDIKNDLLKKLNKAGLQDNDIAAIFADRSFGGVCLVFTAKGIVCAEGFKYELVKYDQVKMISNYLMIGSDKFKCKEANIQAIYNLCNELASLVAAANQPNTTNRLNELPYNSPASIEGK